MTHNQPRQTEMNKQVLLQLIDKVTHCAMSFAQDPKNEHASRRLQDAQQALIKALSPFFGPDSTTQAQQQNLTVGERPKEPYIGPMHTGEKGFVALYPQQYKDLVLLWWNKGVDATFTLNGISKPVE